MPFLQTEHTYHKRGIFEVEPERWILLPDIPEHFRTEEETTWGFTRVTPAITRYVKISDIIRNSVYLAREKNFQLLESFYTFSNPIEVKEYLLTHSYLIEILFEAYRQIKRIFESSVVKVCLEYDRDPEENFEGLFAIVKTDLSPELSLDLLDKLDEEWWLDVDDEIRTILTIMVRPV